MEEIINELISESFPELRNKSFQIPERAISSQPISFQNRSVPGYIFMKF